MIVGVFCHQAGRSSFTPIWNCFHQAITFWTGEGEFILGKIRNILALTVGICLFAIIILILLPTRLLAVEHSPYGLVGLDQIGQAHSGIGRAGGWQINHCRSIPLLLQIRQAVPTVKLACLASCSEYGVDRCTVQQTGDVGRHDIGD